MSYTFFAVFERVDIRKISVLNVKNISPTLVIYTSMERSSQVLQHAHGKCEFYKIKVAKGSAENFVRETSFSKVIYRGSVAVTQCSSDARCPPW